MVARVVARAIKIVVALVAVPAGYAAAGADFEVAGLAGGGAAQQHRRDECEEVDGGDHYDVVKLMSIEEIVR